MASQYVTQGFKFFSSVPVLHSLQVVRFMNILYTTV